ncbi:hypothetical protein CGRA01v4_13566 [Colletotrichum graminicola]|nr:hypothetical protein CGRA01v4_13566 [Colletotrichum graminicola]
MHTQHRIHISCTVLVATVRCTSDPEWNSAPRCIRINTNTICPSPLADAALPPNQPSIPSIYIISLRPPGPFPAHSRAALPMPRGRSVHSPGGGSECASQLIACFAHCPSSRPLPLFRSAAFQTRDPCATGRVKPAVSRRRTLTRIHPYSYWSEPAYNNPRA